MSSLLDLKIYGIFQSLTIYFWQSYGERVTLRHCRWGCEMRSLPGREISRYLTKLHICLPFNQAIPLLETYPKDSLGKACKYTCRRPIIVTFVNSKDWNNTNGVGKGLAH